MQILRSVCSLHPQRRQTPWVEHKLTQEQCVKQALLARIQVANICITRRRISPVNTAVVASELPDGALARYTQLWWHPYHQTAQEPGIHSCGGICITRQLRNPAYTAKVAINNYFNYLFATHQINKIQRKIRNLKIIIV